MTATPLLRFPLNTLAIPLGLTGLAEIWSDADDALHFPVPIAEVFWAIAAVATVWTVVAHIVRGIRSGEKLATQLRHPVQGPIAAMLPIIVMLVGINLYEFWAAGGTVLIVVGIAAAALFAGWIVAFWLRGELALESVHGAFFLPSVAASFVAGGAASVIHAHMLAAAAFVVGAFFWVIMFALVGARLAFRAPLPGPLTPTMAVLMAPPGVGGLAWFAYNGGRIDFVEEGLMGILVIALLMQLQFLRRYVKLSFSLGFWSFVFPSAFVGAFVSAFVSKATFPGWQGLVVVVLAAVTALAVVIAVLSLRLYARGRATAHVASTPQPTPTDVLETADDSIEV